MYTRLQCMIFIVCIIICFMFSSSFHFDIDRYTDYLLMKEQEKVIRTPNNHYYEEVGYYPEDNLHIIPPTE